MSPDDIADSLAVASLTVQLAVSAAVEELRALPADDPRRQALKLAMSTAYGRMRGTYGVFVTEPREYPPQMVGRIKRIDAHAAPMVLDFGSDTVVALPVKPRTCWTSLHHLDGRRWASSSHFGPGGAWNWIVESVTAEHGCSEDDVHCVESGEDQPYDCDDLVTIDGLPVYRIVHFSK